MRSSFGSAKTELMPGAKNAVETCLAVRAGEYVALIADKISEAVAASLAAALKDRGAEYDAFLLEDFGPRPMRDAPALDSRRARKSRRRHPVHDPTARRTRRAHGHRKNRRTPPDSLRPHGRRHAEIMQQGMRADYRLVDRLSDKLRERMLRAETLTVKTDAGTNIAAHFDRGLDWVKTSGLISPRYWSNLPAGEVFTTPATVDGTFVCDATAGDHFNGKYGDLQSTPLVAENQRRPLGRRRMRAQRSRKRILGVLPHRRKQRPRRRTRLRHQPRISA